MSFIDEHRARFGGVEPICRVLKEHGVDIAPSTYHAAKRRPPSRRALRDAWLKDQIRRIHRDNYGVYGADRSGGPCTARALRSPAHGGTADAPAGTVRRRARPKIRTTVRDDGHERARDLLRRDFTAPSPNRRWVADFTYVATWDGIVYVAFVVDIYSRAIVGWSAATNKRTQFVLDAVEMALWRRDRDGKPVGKGLIHHSDAGSQYTAFRFTAHLAGEGIATSIGTVGDALDNALMESAIGPYKTELIKRRGPWRKLADVELDTAEWVDWYNHRRVRHDAPFDRTEVRDLRHRAVAVA